MSSLFALPRADCCLCNRTFCAGGKKGRKRKARARFHAGMGGSGSAGVGVSWEPRPGTALPGHLPHCAGGIRSPAQLSQLTPRQGLLSFRLSRLSFLVPVLIWGGWSGVCLVVPRGDQRIIES